jgi:hypothetical protein
MDQIQVTYINEICILCREPNLYFQTIKSALKINVVRSASM